MARWMKSGMEIAELGIMMLTLTCGTFRKEIGRKSWLIHQHIVVRYFNRFLRAAKMDQPSALADLGANSCAAVSP